MNKNDVPGGFGKFYLCVGDRPEAFSEPSCHCCVFCLCVLETSSRKREPALSETEISPVSLWLFQLILTTTQDENLVAM